MFNYLIRRLLYSPLIIFGVMLLTFVIFFVVQKPEQMARGILGKRATPANTYAWLHKRGYDKPLFFNTGQERQEARWPALREYRLLRHHLLQSDEALRHT